jgi:hypothetical protein
MYVCMYVCISKLKQCCESAAFVCMYERMHRLPATLIFIMTVFFFSIKKTQAQIPEPKRTGSVFVLTVRYQLVFLIMLKKRQSL